jgi:hypothetical protein
MIRFVKNLEIAIMLLAAWGFYDRSGAGFAGVYFPDGCALHAVWPGQVCLLPQVLNERELTGGNGMVEMGTFVAILLGNVVGGLLVAIPILGTATVAIACVAWPWWGAWWRLHPPGTGHRSGS